jgi:hypothetical protein
MEMWVVEGGLEGQLALECGQVVIGLALLGRTWLDLVHKICGVM